MPAIVVKPEHAVYLIEPRSRDFGAASLPIACKHGSYALRAEARLALNQTAGLRPGFFFGSIRCENTACRSSEALSSSRLSLLSM